MKICVVPRLQAGEMPASLPECDIALIGFGYLGDVDYDAELSGRSDKLGQLTRLTRRSGCAAVCGCRTDSRGLKRKSAAVAEGGRLLGITDMLHVVDGENYKSGAYLGLYKLGGYRVGLCIENDLHFPESIKSLSLCGCNIVLCLLENAGQMSPLLARAYAYLYGVPFVMSAGNCAYFADIAGAIVTSTSPFTLFAAQPKNNYRIVCTRERGAFCEERGDY